MRNIIEAFARSWQRTLLAALTVLATSSPALGDPTITYSTYLGGSLRDGGSAVAAWGGSSFIAGITRSLDYPVVHVTSSKPYDQFADDVFVTVLGPSGSPLYSTYVRTSDADHKFVLGIGVGPDGGPSGSPYVVSEGLYADETVISVVKLWPGGSVAWAWGTNGGRLYAQGMAVDRQGNVYITGRNNNEDANYQYMDKAFVWKISASGSLIYSISIDGNGFDLGRGVAVDSAGNAYVTGVTRSTDLPGANGQPVPAGGGDNAFVTKLDPAGAVLWTTYLGGGGYDEGSKIAVAADNSVVVVGITQSSDFPTQNALQTGLKGPQDLFLARLMPYGSVISSTYLGGSGSDAINDLALEPASILLAVDSPDADSPLRGPLDPSCTSSFIAKLDATASRVLDASCRGGAVAADSTGVSVTGGADSGLPVVNAWQPAPAGGGDAFAMKLVLNHPPDCSRAVASPDTLWPAGGNFVSVVIRGVTDPEGDALSIAFTSIFQDEWYTYSGQPDASGLGASTARLRASRLNGGDGRVYHLSFTATDPWGATCAGAVKVCVPPVQGGTCVDGGARVNSTQSY
jgi:Beta-propeller repeat